MRILTEEDLRSSFSVDGIKKYTVPPDVFVTPAARDYLAARGIAVSVVNEGKTDYDSVRGASQTYTFFVDAKTGRRYSEKPEEMTHLYGNRLVPKTSPIIDMRGKLDLLQSEIITAQVTSERCGLGILTSQLGEVLLFTRDILAAEVLSMPLEEKKLLSMTSDELRKVSHDIKNRFVNKMHPLPEYTMGEMAAQLNRLRAVVRQTELSAASAVPERRDIIKALNRLSSCIHILFCRLILGDYGDR